MERLDKMRSMCEWPMNVINVLHEKNPEVPVDPSKMPNDFFATFEYILSTAITARDRMEIMMYFKDGLSYYQISKSFDCSGSRIQSRIAHTLRRLAHWSRVNILKVGIDQHIKDMTQVSYDRGYKYGLRDGLARGEEIAMNTIRGVLRAKASENTTIEEMDLSVRSYNCLKRAGYEVVKNVADATNEEIAAIRNLGLKSLREIAQRLETDGVKTNWDVESVIKLHQYQPKSNR